MTDIFLEDIKQRIEAVGDASKRSLLAFLAMNTASAAVILAAWNAYLSWNRSFALHSFFASGEVTHEAQRELLQKWVDSTVISISPLGITLGVSDLALVGARPSTRSGHSLAPV